MDPGGTPRCSSRHSSPQAETRMPPRLKTTARRRGTTRRSRSPPLASPGPPGTLPWPPRTLPSAGTVLTGGDLARPCRRSRSTRPCARRHPSNWVAWHLLSTRGKSRSTSWDAPLERGDASRRVRASWARCPRRRLRDGSRIGSTPLLYRGNPTPWSELREELNRLVTGWANDFSFGWTGEADTAIHWHVAQRARRLRLERHKLPRGSGRFSLVEVYGPTVGVLDVWRYRKRAASCMPSGEASP